MRQEELEAILRTWKMLTRLREGFKIECKDPLFAPRPRTTTKDKDKKS